RSVGHDAPGLGRRGATSGRGTGLPGQAPYTVALDSRTTVATWARSAAASRRRVSGTSPRWTIAPTPSRRGAKSLSSVTTSSPAARSASTTGPPRWPATPLTAMVPIGPTIACVSFPGPLGGGDDPFAGLPMFRDLAKMLSGSGPVNWEIARQVSTWIATDGQPEGNVDPIARMHVEELARVAVLHVADVTGLETSATGGIVTVRPVGRAEWTQRTLDAYRPVLEQLATSLSAATGDDDAADA